MKKEKRFVWEKSGVNTYITCLKCGTRKESFEFVDERTNGRKRIICPKCKEVGYK